MRESTSSVLDVVWSVIALQNRRARWTNGAIVAEIVAEDVAATVATTVA